MENLEDIKKYLKGKIVIVGIGDCMRGDDGVGCKIAEDLKEKLQNEKITIINAGTTPENYLEKIVKYNPDLILFIDSSDFGCLPGDVKLLKPEEVLNAGTSTHNASLKLVFDYLEKRTDSSILLLGIQPKKIYFSTEISNELQKSIKEVENTVMSYACPPWREF